MQDVGYATVISTQNSPPDCFCRREGTVVPQITPAFQWLPLWRNLLEIWGDLSAAVEPMASGVWYFATHRWAGLGAPTCVLADPMS